MKAATVLYCITLMLFVSCSKTGLLNNDHTAVKQPSAELVANDSTVFTIKQGNHYCDKNNLVAVSYSKLQFIATFDSSAIYKSITAENQFDINKLFGFSDNNTAHHVNSARFGWRWSDDALRLFAYVYNNSKVEMKEIGTAQIGSPVQCSIEVLNGKYLFRMNDAVLEMPRASTTATGSGYKLYPYFGGDEVAPHEIRIEIREI